MRFNLYEKNKKSIKLITAEYGASVNNELGSIEKGVLVLCIKPKDLNEFLKSNSDKISGDVLICTVLAGIDTSIFFKVY